MKSNYAKTLMATAAALLTTATALAQNPAQGTTHDHPISDALVEQYLTQYLGVYNYSAGNWGFTATRDKGMFDTKYTYYPITPTGTETGDVIFVEVNDYWKGNSNWSQMPDLYNQVKYGIKSINKVTSSTPVGNGMLYHFAATTNRFFFAIRTSTMATANASAWNAGGGDTYVLDERARADMMAPLVSYVTPFRWYNEFSSVLRPETTGWDQLKASYDDMKYGDFLPVPHSCYSSLKNNHFTTLYDKETTDQTYTVSAMLFVPTTTRATTNVKGTGQQYTGNSIPQVFFYVNSLTGERQPSDDVPSNIVIDLRWSTSIDKAQSSNINIQTYSSSTGGIKEESHIYRKIEGSDDFTEVDIVDGLVDLKTWSDRTLPAPTTDTGYDVTYYVITKAITYNAAGERLGEEIAQAVSNQVTFHVPGAVQYFELSLSNVFDSKFTPAAGKINQSYNLIKNEISSQATEFTPSLDQLRAGHTFTLKRDEESKGYSDVNTLVINGVNHGTYSYTLNGEAGQAAWTSTQQVLDLVAHHTDEIKSIPGNLYDTRYQLLYNTGTTEYFSNVVTAQGKRTDVMTQKLYRSGTPDTVKNALEELYTAQVKFKPIMSDDIAYYYIWRSAQERVIRVDWTGNAFALVGKDSNGNFNDPLGSIELDDEGYITVQLDNAVASYVRTTELGDGQSLADNDLFFTVEVCTTGGNSYGNRDRTTTFEGSDDELVVNAQGVFYSYYDNPGLYRAELNWTKVMTQDNLSADDYVAGEPDYYTVHRWRVSEGEMNYEPITARYVGHDNVYDSEGNIVEAAHYEIADQTTDGSAYHFTPEMMTAEDFRVIDFVTDEEFMPTEEIAFPAIYYVKAHYVSPFAASESALYVAGINRYPLQHFVEKNSNAVVGTTEPISTGVNDIVMANVVSTSYYNILGQPVLNPAAGTIVIAQYRMSNGTTQARLIRK